MTDILLTHSYFLQFDPKQAKAMMPYPPLGTLYAASFLESRNFSVAFFDTMLAESEEELRSAIERHRPDIVAIYDDDFNYLNKMCLSRMRDAAHAMSAIAKEYGAFVIVHGSDAVDHAEKYLTHSADAVIVGEGEQSLAELCHAVLYRKSDVFGDIPGLVYRTPDGSLRRTAKRPVRKNLDELPLPAWYLVDHDAYRTVWKEHHGYHSINIVTTRGCPFHCNWCAKPIYGQVYNSRSPEHVVEEIQYIMRTIRPDHIWFADDIFGLKPGWVKKFSLLMQEKDLHIRFKIQSRVDLLLEDTTVDDLARAGCDEIWVGAESGSQKILDAMEKGTTVRQIYEATALLKKHSIRTAFFLQFGYPGESADDIRATLRMVKDLLPDNIGISVTYPLPGTKLYENVRSQLQDKQNWTDSDDLALMFRGTYSPAYYKRLHRYVHKSFRMWQGFDLLKKIFSLRIAAGIRHVTRILSIGYYVPAALYDRYLLFQEARR